MPAIPIDLSNVESSFEELPVGKYLGEISKFRYREATEEGKFDQLMITYTVIDGDLLGKTSTEFRSLSPKALGFVTSFFLKFGFEKADMVEGFLDYDDDTMDMTSPDIIGTRVIFQVKEDAKAPGGFRTELVSVEDDVPAPATAVAAAPVAEAEPVAEAAPAPRRAPAKPPARAAAPARRSLR